MAGDTCLETAFTFDAELSDACNVYLELEANISFLGTGIS